MLNNLDCKLILKFSDEPEVLMTTESDFKYDLEYVHSTAMKIYRDFVSYEDKYLVYPIMRAIVRDAFSRIDKTWKNVGHFTSPINLIEESFYFSKTKVEDIITDDYSVELVSESLVGVPFKVRFFHKCTFRSSRETYCPYVLRPFVILECNGETYDKDLYKPIAKYSGQGARRAARIAIANGMRNSLTGELAIKKTRTYLSDLPELIVPYFDNDFYFDNGKYISRIYWKVSLSDKPITNGFYRVQNKERVLIVKEKVSELY